MTELDAIDYLGLQDACLQAVTREADLSIIEFAEDRGFYTGVWNGITVEYAQAHATGLPGYDDYQGDLDADLNRIAIEAVEFLTDEGLLPHGYGQRPERATDGYGLIETGEGS